MEGSVPPAERRALAAARAALIAERHLAQEVVRRQRAAEAKAGARRLEGVPRPGGVVYLWEDGDHLAGRWDAGWPEHEAGWIEERMPRRPVDEALAWARERAEIWGPGRAAIGTRPAHGIRAASCPGAPGRRGRMTRRRCRGRTGTPG